jgi:hypothetical protein
MRPIARTTVLVLGVILALDLAAGLTLRELMPSWNLRYYDNTHRIRSEVFHHGLTPGREVLDVWGRRGYRLAINSLGFKDRSARHVPADGGLPRLVVIGDSFTEGVGFPFEETFAGHLSSALESKGVEVLNAGVISFAPSLYYRRLRDVIVEKGMRIDEVVVFLDISDIFEEAVSYKEDANGRLIVPAKRDRTLRTARHWYRDHSLIARTFYVARDARRLSKRRNSVRKTTAAVLGRDPDSLTDTEMQLYHSITLPGSRLAHDPSAWKEYGDRGRAKAARQMSLLAAMLRERNIPLTVVVYPWPAHLLLDPEGNGHVDFWGRWAADNGAGFIDLFPVFTATEAADVLERYFIDFDVHWNADGHRLVAESFLERYCGAPSCRDTFNGRE